MANMFFAGWLCPAFTGWWDFLQHFSAYVLLLLPRGTFRATFPIYVPHPSYSWKPGFDNHTYSLFLILLYTLSIYYQSSYILWSIYLYCCPNHIEKTLLIFTKKYAPLFMWSPAKEIFLQKPIQFLIAPYIYPFCPQILRQTVFLRIHPTNIHSDHIIFRNQRF